MFDTLAAMNTTAAHDDPVASTASAGLLVALTATPSSTETGVPMLVPSRENCTVPCGVPAEESLAETAAVKVISWP